MAQIKWTEPALLDLQEIAEYIALDKPSAAKKLVKTVFKKVLVLKKFPESGRTPLELAKSDYRELVVPPFRIFYRVKSEYVYILYVMRSERLLKNFILDEREK